MRTVEIKTDHNVSIDWELSKVSNRVLAALIDVVILVAYNLIMALLLSTAFDSGVDSRGFWYTFYIIIVYLPFFLYTPLMEYFNKGQTLGKMALNIRVVRSNGENADFKSIFTRWLFRPLEFYILIFSGFGVFFILGTAILDIMFASISKQSQRLGDLMADTIVVAVKPSKSYALVDVLAIKNDEGHQATYPNVIQFTDEEMLLLRKTINRVYEFKNAETKAFAIEFASHIADRLELQAVPKKRMQFLKTVLDDYIVLTR